MDPFETLPTELLSLIFQFLSGAEGSRAFSHASPVMLRKFDQLNISMSLKYISKYMDDDIIQDALAIIHFPRASNAMQESTGRERFDVVDQHLRLWGRKGLSDPTKDRSFHMRSMKQLETLCRHLWLYIDDFLSKATSDYLPRAYRRLPRWSPRSISLLQARLKRDVSYFDRRLLDRNQIRQITKAFLRYELLCLIYGPLETDKLNFDFYQEQQQFEDKFGDRGKDDYHYVEHDPFRHWDWRILDKYEYKRAELVDSQLLPCVREYVITLYGAYFAVCKPLPNTHTSHPEFENAPGYHQQEFPACEIEGEVHDSERLISLVASAGFDVLTSVLTRGWTIYTLKYEMSIVPPRSDATNIDVPPDGPSKAKGSFWHPNSFIRLYRQRAWPLFREKGRARGPNLPSERKYSQLFGPKPEGDEDRVDWGPGGDHTRNERICHGGGRWGVKALQKLMKTRFWESQALSECID
jgi:hypothetical protein